MLLHSPIREITPPPTGRSKRVSEGLERENPCVCPAPFISGTEVTSLCGMWERRRKHGSYYTV